MNYIENFNLFGVDAQQIPCIKNNGAPTSSTEGAVGCLYMDTSSDSKDIYKCVSAHNGSYTWEKVVNVDKDYVDNAIKEVNGIKYITENCDAWSLDDGVYIIADPYPMVTLENSFGQFVNTGTLIISSGVVYGKIITFIGEDGSAYEPYTAQFYINDELGELITQREFIDKNYVDDKIKEINGIKYITESVEAHSLDYGVYMIDNNEGGFVTFYDGETQNITNIILGQELYGGVIIVSKDLVYDKMLTCFSTNSSGWAIIFCVGVSDNEYGDADTLSFATTKDLKGDIAFLQAQIDELKNK
jgi:hypothetical protein